jgi:hypothetical protein
VSEPYFLWQSMQILQCLYSKLIFSSLMILICFYGMTGFEQ